MLTEVFVNVLPLFMGILVGYLASYWSRFKENAEPPLSAFVFYVALPALLFVVTAEAGLDEGIPASVPGLVVASTLAFALLIFVPLRFSSERNLDTSVAASMSASYGNVAYLGIPVALGLLGPEGGLPAVVVQLIHNLIFVVGYPVLHELLFSKRAPGPGRWKAVGATIVRALFTSPLVWAIALGFVVGMTKTPVPGPIMSFADMLAGAAAPGALFAIGLTLRGAVRVLRGGKLRIAPVWIAAAGKLLVLPAITALAALLVAPDLARPWLVVLVLMAGMPTSATAFVLAQTNGGDGRTVAAIILVTNAFALLTLPLVSELFT
jgi:malonate transporter and related proteins